MIQICSYLNVPNKFHQFTGSPVDELLYHHRVPFPKASHARRAHLRRLTSAHDWKLAAGPDVVICQSKWTALTTPGLHASEVGHELLMTSLFHASQVQEHNKRCPWGRRQAMVDHLNCIFDWMIGHVYVCTNIHMHPMVYVNVNTCVYIYRYPQMMSIVYANV